MRDWLIKLKLFYMDMDCRLVGCITILIIVWLLTRWTQFNLSCVWLCGYQNRENNSPRKACCPELRSKIMHIYYRGYIYEWCLFWEYIILYRFIFFLVLKGLCFSFAWFWFSWPSGDWQPITPQARRRTTTTRLRMRMRIRIRLRNYGYGTTATATANLSNGWITQERSWRAALRIRRDASTWLTWSDRCTLLL